MLGFDSIFILGRLGETPVLRKNGTQSYMYFRVCVNSTSRLVNGVTQQAEPRWYTCSASGFQAEHIAKTAVKGDVICFTATMRTKQTEREKDGKIYVYNDIVLSVNSSHVDIMHLEPYQDKQVENADQTATPPSDSESVPTPNSAPVQTEDASAYFTQEDEEVVGALPF